MIIMISVTVINAMCTSRGIRLIIVFIIIMSLIVIRRITAILIIMRD